MASYRQIQLRVAYSPTWKRQTSFGTALDQSELTATLNVTTRRHIQLDENINDIFDCTGRYKTDARIISRLGRLTIEMDADAINLTGLLAFAMGVAGSPGTVGAASEIQSMVISGTPTGGTYRLIGILTTGQTFTTDALAYNANAAAITAALEANSSGVGYGSGNVTVTGSGPYTITFGSGLANTELKTIYPTNVALTGGTSPSISITSTTEGGPAHKSHQITEYSGYQKPFTTFIVGFADPAGDPTPVIFQDATLNTLTVTGKVGERTTVAAEFVGRGDLAPATGFTFPACANSPVIQFTDGSLKLNNTEYIQIARAVEFKFNNNLFTNDDPFTGISIDPTRLETADIVESGFTLSLEGIVGDAVSTLAKANNGLGTIMPIAWRIGSGSNGVTISAPEAALRHDNDPQGFDGEANRAILNLIGDPYRSTNDSLKPTNALAQNTQAAQYLVAA